MMRTEQGGGVRRRLLAINFFPAFVPPSSGGEQRYFHLYERLSSHFDVTLVSASYADRPEEQVDHSEYFREIRVPKHPESDRLHWMLEGQGIGPECSGYVVALAGALGGRLQERISELAPGMDAIIHECPFTVPYDLGIGRDGIPRVYNSYNVESELALKMLKGEAGAKAAAFIAELEQYLVSRSALVLATSEDERDAFVSRYGAEPARTHVVPNGFDEAQFGPADAAAAKTSGNVLFLGSHHPPNVEALEYVVRELAGTVPDRLIQVLGSVCKAYTGPVPDNVELLGFVSPALKSSLLASCALAVNPMLSGAGTNLKMLDYLAHGTPVVATPVGARGLALVDGEHLLIADLPDFPAAVTSLLSDTARARALGDAGRRLANERYAWSSIGDDMAKALERMLDGPSARLRPRKRLLSICDYPINRPTGGGQVRIRSLLAELAQEFEVTYLCFSDDGIERRDLLEPGLMQHCIPKTAAHLAEEKSTSEGQWVSIADLVSARHCNSNPRLVEVFRQEQAVADCILFEQCYMAPLAAQLPPSKPVVYSSQNVEYDLKRALYAARTDDGDLAGEIEAIELALVRRSSLVICVSEEDRKQFLAREPAAPALVVENGVKLSPCAQGNDEPGRGAFAQPMAVFLGSAHPPNVAAAKFIASDVAPKVPNVNFALVGSVCDALSEVDVPGNVFLMGFLSDPEKAALLGMADMAVNPMFDGGGSSLKVADFLAAGLPTISSRIGVRGFAVLDDVHYIAAEREQFADTVSHCAARPAELKRIGHEARYFAETNLCWRILAGKLRRAIRGLVPGGREKNRLLVTTYRFGEPPRGGAEVFLQKVLGHLHASGRWDITVVAPAVGAIHNHLHFSAIYEPPGEGDRIADDFRDRTLLFPVVDSNEDAAAHSAQLHALWARESLELGAILAPRLPAGSLLGGWNYPEQARRAMVRWATRRAQVKLPQTAGAVRIELMSPSPQTARFRCGDEMLHVAEVSGEASLCFRFPHGGGVLDMEFPVPHDAAGDPREISVLVTRIVIESEGIELACDLSRGIEQIPAQVPLQQWVEALVDIASRRDPLEDRRFLKARGPNCPALETWLEAHASDHDVILAQGVPFSTSCIGVGAARRSGVPVVVLPHFHPADRYYHWRSFYDAFRQADCVVAAPTATKSLVLDRIGAPGRVLAGGGVVVSEFGEQRMSAAREAFLRVHPATKPFVLVLGRKAAGKNYRQVIDAMANKGSSRQNLELVIIGPDEDGVPIKEADVHYLGPQPRDVVLGALAEATCLATMSESESFGIVLLEAWLAGTPVIANRRCASFAELVDHNRNGYLVETRQELVDAISQYAADPALAATHAAAGRILAREFDWSCLADALSGLLESVCTDEYPAISNRNLGKTA